MPLEIATEGGVVRAALVLLAWVVTIYVLLPAVARNPSSQPSVRAALTAIIGAGPAQAQRPAETGTPS